MITFLIFMFVELIFPFSFFIIFFVVIKAFSDNFKRANIHNYFKQNVIPGTAFSLGNELLDVTMKDLNNFKNKTSTLYKDNYIDVTPDKLALFNVSDINTLKDYFYNIFLEFEKAYNNLDYPRLKALSTEQLYENYYTGISLDLKIGNKRIIDNIKRKSVTIYELDSTVAKQVVSTLIEISYTNYMIDRNGNIISGKTEPISEKFIIQFRKDFKNSNIKNCPNCGAPISNTICSYCGTPLKNNEFRICSIKRII